MPKEKATERKHTCTFPGCGQVFQRTDHLKRHVQHRHGKQAERYGCPICNRTFKRLDNLQQHQQEKHQLGEKMSYGVSLGK